VLEDGKGTSSETGTVQGSNISPLLANVYLHYIFDLWFQHWRNRHVKGDVIVVRYADDFIGEFQSKTEAEAFLVASPTSSFFIPIPQKDPRSAERPEIGFRDAILSSIPI
jgi:hypothetical protein